MKRDLGRLDRKHRFSHEIIGLGHRIIIPSLNRDGKYNIPVFRKSGFRSLIAVPITTYRIHGILGAAYREKMKFSQDFTELLAVIANLVGMSLHQSMIYKQTSPKKPAAEASQDKMRPVTKESQDSTTKENPKKDIKLPPGSRVREKDRGGSFHDHDRSMKLFTESHQ